MHLAESLLEHLRTIAGEELGVYLKRDLVPLPPYRMFML